MPTDTKRVLIEQAGGKCSNPGCANRLLEVHHVHEWHVYQTHDAAHMIALCAACHDSVTRGDLQITDDELYEWKRIDRSTSTPTGHLFVEPGESPRLLLGSIAVEGGSGVIVFDLSEHHRLSFAVRDEDIMLINLKIASVEGTPLLDVVDGYVRQRDPAIELRTRP
ncbi:MAG: HNH endonuclease, partial [Sporichthyaceae bacterium]|nr:HNH endonuclease [Sporichthyaceae bacterium]